MAADGNGMIPRRTHMAGGRAAGSPCRRISSPRRAHWDGLFQFGVDVGVLNVTKDAVWYRKAVLPDLSGQVPPMREMIQKAAKAGIPLPTEFPFPEPRRTRDDQQEQLTCDLEIDPHKYYPPDVYREQMTTWPRDFKIDLTPMLPKPQPEKK